MGKDEDLGSRQTHHFALRNGTMDFYVGWLYGYAQLGGLSPGSIADCLATVRSGDPESWVRSFVRGLDFQREQAALAEKQGLAGLVAHHHLAAVTAARAALHFAIPESARWRELVAAMESSFQAATRDVFETWPVTFKGHMLPAYATPGVSGRETVLVVVGGGDTFREDLWFFGGGAAAERGCGVVLCDLPGQGTTPADGLHFGMDTVLALAEVVDTLRREGCTGRIVLLGWSGGGYFTTKAVELLGEQVDAWIASTPVHDMAALLESAMPAVLRRNPEGLWQRLGIRAAGRLSPVLRATLEKYDWQFGPSGIGGAISVLREAGSVALDTLDVPLLALVGASEAQEARAQARQVYDAVRARRPSSALVEFAPASGADAHCQVNNLPLAFECIVAWLSALEATSGRCQCAHES